MSDPFWDELDRSLPRAKRGEAGWAHQRGKVLAAARGQAPRRRLAGALAFGLAAAAVLLTFNRRGSQPPPPSAQMPSEDLEFLESADLLENLDELIDATELDRA